MRTKISNLDNNHDDKIEWFTLTITPLLFVVACLGVDIRTGFKDPIVTLFLIMFSIFALVPSIRVIAKKVMLVKVG